MKLQKALGCHKPLLCWKVIRVNMAELQNYTKLHIFRRFWSVVCLKMCSLTLACGIKATLDACY